MVLYMVNFPKSMAKGYSTGSKREAFEIAEEGMRRGNGNAVIEQWKGNSTTTLEKTWHVRKRKLGRPSSWLEVSSWVERGVRHA